LERDFGVADGFSTLLLGPNDLIASQTLLDIFDLKANDSLNVKYEIMTFMPSDVQNGWKIATEYNPKTESDPSKGEVFLEYIGLNKTMLVIDFKNLVINSYP